MKRLATMNASTGIALLKVPWGDGAVYNEVIEASFPLPLASGSKPTLPLLLACYLVGPDPPVSFS